MNLSSRKELVAVLAIWALLMAVACTTLLVLNRNAIQIISHLEYETGSRFAKATVLYTEADKYTAKVLSTKDTSATLSYTDANLSTSLDLLMRAAVLDPRPRFAPEREKYYRLQGDLHGLAGGSQEQLIYYGLASLCRKDYSAAALYSQRSLKEGNDGPSQLLEAEVQYAVGKKDLAKNILRTVVQSTTASADAHELLSRIYAEDKDEPAAAAELKQAIEKRKFDTDLRKSLAKLLMRQNKPQEALQVLRDGLPVGGASDGNYLHIFGDILRVQPNDVKEGVAVLEKAVQLESNSGDLFLSLARAHEAIGNKRQAAEALQRAVALKPDLQKEILKP